MTTKLICIVKSKTLYSVHLGNLCLSEPIDENENSNIPPNDTRILT